MEKGSGYQSKYSNSWALIIGINEYDHTSPLDYATNDADAIAELLKTKFSFPEENIVLLKNKDASADSIREAYMQYSDANKIQQDDRLLVFFAGHGLTLHGKRGEVGFLVPADGNPDEVNTLMRWDEFTRNADLIPAKHIFFMMDACYSGLAFVRSPAFGNMRFLGDMLQRYSRQVLTAGKADEAVADGNGVRPGHSIFTAHLLDALEGSAATQEGIITANGVMAYVYDRVARDQYSHQTPHYGFIDGDGDFIFDTSLLDSLREEKEGPVPEGEKAEGERGDEDILINTSPQVISAPTSETSVSEAVKELLSDPAKRIKLDDYVSHYIKRFLDETDLRNFPVQGVTVEQEEFVARVARYEELVKDLQQIVILLAKWGNSEQLLQLEKIFTRLAEADKGNAGTVLWMRLSWYPLHLLMYTAGITALAVKKYEVLRMTFETTVQEDPLLTRGPRALVIPIVDNLTDIHDSFKWLPEQERKYVPRSEHVFKSIQPTLEDMLSLGRNYENLFDTFEVLFALAYSNTTGHGWGPPGRFGWKHDRGYEESPLKRVIEEAKKGGANWGPVRAGLFKGSAEEFEKNALAFSEVVNKWGYW